MKLFIFDIDGTLTDTKAVDDFCFIKAFQNTFQVDIKDQVWADLQNVTDWGITEEIVQQRLQRNPTEKEYQLMHDHHISNLKSEKIRDAKQFEAVLGANNFLKELSKLSNISIALATGAWEQSALIKLAVIDLVSKNVPFSNSDYYKTREEITQHAITQAKSKYQDNFDEIVYFGDGEWDFKTCKNLDIRFIGIDITNNQKLVNLGAKEVYPNFLDTKTILNSLI